MDADMLEYFESCDDIIKTDRVSHVEKYTSAMDVYVLPSYREGFGMGVIEASAMGVPVVVTKYPAFQVLWKRVLVAIRFQLKMLDLLTEYILKFLEQSNGSEENRTARTAMGRKTF